MANIPPTITSPPRRYYPSVHAWVIIPLITLTLGTYVLVRFASQSYAANALLRVATMVETIQQRFISNTEQLLESLAHVPVVGQADSQTCPTVLSDLLKKYPNYANLGVANTKGDIVCSAVPLKAPVNIADRTYFQRAVETKKFAVGDYQVGRITGKPSINFAYPTLTAEGNVDTVLYAALDLQWVSKFAEESHFPPEVTFTILDKDGLVLARYPSPEVWIGKTWKEGALFHQTTGQSQKLTHTKGVDGVKRYYAFVPLPSGNDFDTVTTVGVADQSLFAPANYILFFSILFDMVVILAFSLIWRSANKN